MPRSPCVYNGCSIYRVHPRFSYGNCLLVHYLAAVFPDNCSFSVHACDRCLGCGCGGDLRGPFRECKYAEPG